MTVITILSLSVLCLLLWQQTKRVTALEEQLSSFKEVQEIRITKATVKTREEERMQLARDWHDNMGNLVTTARFLLDAIDTTSPRLLTQAKLLLEEAHEVAKDIYSGAAQPIFSTEAELSRYCMNIQHQLGLRGIEFEYVIQEVELAHLSKDQLWHFANILKELITNVIKHAQATRLQVEVATIAQKIHLQVRDNGKGFESSVLTAPKTIQERLHLLNGQLSIETNSPSGTIMRIEF